MTDIAMAALSVRALSKSFGAVQASRDINLDVQVGEIHAVIGPNGAGKSTLIAQICGEITPDAGAVYIGAHEVSAQPAYRHAQLGLGRSFQITQLCQEFTALENVLLSVMMRSGGLFDMWRNPRRDPALLVPAHSWIERVGLAGRESVAAGLLAHGERRQLEMAVALAREPKVLLLDEPMAGMGPEESTRMTRLFQSLKNHYAILLVEHDMGAVFALADRVSVLVYGEVIFTGTPDEARADAAVRSAYLGEGHAIG